MLGAGRAEHPGTFRKRAAPYGSWESPITAEAASAGGVRLDSPSADGEDRYWLEGRPTEQGRVVLVRRRGGTVSDLTPPPFSVRTRVHEYGGGSYLAAGGTVWFSNLSDQRLWRIAPGGEPEALTAAPPAGTPVGTAPVRFADARLWSGSDRWLLCVRETHSGPRAADVVNELVALPADAEAGDGTEVVIATGRDFYASPRISPDGTSLAWTCWDHPAMPWDGTELWTASLGVTDGLPTIAEPQLVAGGRSESILQPEWAADGILWFVSDAGGGWWNLWRFQDGSSCPVTSMRAEWGRPQWVLGGSTYAFGAGGTVVGTWSAGGVDHLGLLDPASGQVRELDLPYSRLDHVRAAGDAVLFVGTSPFRAPQVVECALDGGAQRVLARSASIEFDPAGLSSPEAIEFPASGGTRSHAFYYPPTNAGFEGPEAERPPLLVMSHGGPTAATSPALNLVVQYWTSRGIGVVDVNYAGSTGYGRGYRERLWGAWGVRDVDDCVDAARFLVERGDADGARLAIRGSSAGGFTTLCALTFREAFAVGASYYGVSDAAALAVGTHKFESRYLDTLIGPWPAAAEIYRARSPSFHTEELACPVILFQGAEDPVVPPAQAEAMVGALAQRGVRHAYVRFEGEGHGFRRAETLRRCLLDELSFYGAVLGFEPAGPDPLEPGPGLPSIAMPEPPGDLGRF